MRTGKTMFWVLLMSLVASVALAQEKPAAPATPVPNETVRLVDNHRTTPCRQRTGARFPSILGHLEQLA